MLLIGPHPCASTLAEMSCIRRWESDRVRWWWSGVSGWEGGKLRQQLLLLAPFCSTAVPVPDVAAARLPAGTEPVKYPVPS